MTNELLDILNLETLDLDMFRGQTPGDGHRRIYGGQVVAQALAAAYRTIEGRHCHSLHSYFIRPGDPKIPILFQVDRARDGGSFAVRRVVAIQHGKQIFNLAASFQTPETGFEHQLQMPQPPEPETLLNEEELRARAGLAPTLAGSGRWRFAPAIRHRRVSRASCRRLTCAGSEPDSLWGMPWPRINVPWPMGRT